jgi:hypothetical protein
MRDRWASPKCRRSSPRANHTLPPRVHTLRRAAYFALSFPALFIPSYKSFWCMLTRNPANV